MNAGGGRINRFSAGGGRLIGSLDTTSGSASETGMCFDPAGNLYTTNRDTNSVSKIVSAGHMVRARFGSSAVRPGTMLDSPSRSSTS